LLPSPFALQQKKEKGLAIAKPKQKVMVALLPSPFVPQQKDKKRRLVVAKKAMATLSSPSLLQHDQNRSKEKGFKEGAYFQAKLWVLPWFRFRHSKVLTIKVLTMEFMGLLQAHYRGYAPIPTTPELWSCSNSS